MKLYTSWILCVRCSGFVQLLLCYPYRKYVYTINADFRLSYLKLPAGPDLVEGVCWISDWSISLLDNFGRTCMCTNFRFIGFYHRYRSHLLSQVIHPFKLLLNCIKRYRKVSIKKTRITKKAGSFKKWLAHLAIMASVTWHSKNWLPMSFGIACSSIWI